MAAIMNMNISDRIMREQRIDDELALVMPKRTDYDRNCEKEINQVICDPSKMPPIKWVSHDKKWRWSGRYTHNEDWDIQKLLKFGRSYRRSLVYRKSYTYHCDECITAFGRSCVTTALFDVINYARYRNPIFMESFYRSMRHITYRHYPGTKALMRRVEEYFALLD